MRERELKFLSNIFSKHNTYKNTYFEYGKNNERFRACCEYSTNRTYLRRVCNAENVDQITPQFINAYYHVCINVIIKF